MRKLFSKLILCASLLLLCSGSAQAQIPVEAEEYAAYKAVIAHMLNKRGTRPVKLVLLWEQTAINGSKLTSPDWKLRPQGIYGINKDTLDDYVAKNDQQQHLERLFDLKVEYELVNNNDYLKLMFEGTFHKKYPDTLGIIYFSRVGFNQEKTQALIYRKMQTPSGRADYFLLVKEKGIWKIACEKMDWIE